MQWAVEPRGRPSDRSKLSQKYRFAEGAALKSSRWGWTPEYLPAKVQLCQDLLRLGDEAEGWKLAAEIFSKDGYNVVAYNLVTLRDRLAGFRTLEGDGFIVRMDKREAELYGPACWRYWPGEEDTVREVRCHDYGPGDRRDFSAAKEFAVRTFGLPGADGLWVFVSAGWSRRTARRRRANILRTGRPCCGMSFAMWSPGKTATRCPDG